MRNKETLKRVKDIVALYDSDKPKLIRELKRLAREGQKTGDASLVGIACHQLAVACSDIGDMEGCFSYSFKAVEFLKDTDEYESLARALITLGYCYGDQQNNQMELASYDRAYQIIRQHRIRGSARSLLLNNLSSCYHTLGDCKTAIRLLTECLEMTREMTPVDYSDLAMNHLNLAEYLTDDGEADKAREIFASMAEWIDKVEFTPLLCDYYLRYAIALYRLGDREAAERCVDTSFACVPEDLYLPALYDDFRKIMHWLAELRDRARAERIFQLMTVYAEKGRSTFSQLIALRSIAEYHAVFGESARALECYTQLDELYDKRVTELTGIRLNVYKRMKDADAEIQRLKKSMEKNEMLMSIEPMTKLLNRSALLRVSSEFIETAAKKKQKVGAIFIDIDFFKEYNDTYGHTMGDEIIREVARACKAEETAFIRFARYGGDEFFGITRGLTDDEVADVARRICRRIRKADIPHEKNPCGHRLTLSGGVVNVVITENTDTIIEIANYADKAVYFAKNAGKDAIYLLDHGRTDGRDKNSDFVRIDY